MRVVKYFCYEGSFFARLFRIRTQELQGIRKILYPDSRSSFILTFRVQVRPVPTFLWAGCGRGLSPATFIALPFFLYYSARTRTM
jgi:hypothetical protein